MCVWRLHALLSWALLYTLVSSPFRFFVGGLELCCFSGAICVRNSDVEIGLSRTLWHVHSNKHRCWCWSINPVCAHLLVATLIRYCMSCLRGSPRIFSVFVSISRKSFQVESFFQHFDDPGAFNRVHRGRLYPRKKLYIKVTGPYKDDTPTSGVDWTSPGTMGWQGEGSTALPGWCNGIRWPGSFLTFFLEFWQPFCCVTVG